jgi:hypothetical protein
MENRQTSLVTIANCVAAFAALILVAGWLDRWFWQRVPRLLGTSSQTLGLIVLVAWLIAQGYERFLKRGHDKIDILTLQTKSEKLIGRDSQRTSVEAFRCSLNERIALKPSTEIPG